MTYLRKYSKVACWNVYGEMLHDGLELNINQTWFFLPNEFLTDPVLQTTTQGFLLTVTNFQANLMKQLFK